MENLLLLAFAVIISALIIVALNKNHCLVPPRKERNFGSPLAEWAQQRGLRYAPHHTQAISGVYNNRWFAIGTTNEENAPRIRMSVQNPQRTNLQIFGDWLEDSGVVAFVSRFRVYSNPSGLGETLFEQVGVYARPERETAKQVSAVMAPLFSPGYGFCGHISRVGA